MTGFVYAIRSAGVVKIGYSVKPHLRFCKISSESPAPCEMLGAWPGSVRDEKSVHAKFSHLRSHGEWFFYTADLAGFIEATKTLDAKPRAVPFLHLQLPRGGKKALAAALGLGAPAISQWKHVPANHLVLAERITGIPRHELRPDLYPEQAA